MFRHLVFRSCHDDLDIQYADRRLPTPTEAPSAWRVELVVGTRQTFPTGTVGDSKKNNLEWNIHVPQNV